MYISKLTLQKLISIADFHCVETIRYSLYHGKTTAHDAALSDYNYISKIKSLHTDVIDD